MKKLFELINKNLFFEGIFERIKKPAEKKELPIITLSRERGSGGKLIASMVVKKLGKRWKVYHKEIIDKIAKEAKLEKELIKEIDEKRLSFVDQLINDFFGKGYPSLSNYHKHLVKIVSQIANRGFTVIVGRGAEYLVLHALKVRIICEINQRVTWMMKFEELTKKQAIEEINRSDRQRADFIKTLYGHNTQKAHHYDLVIRTGPNLSIEDAADLIVKAAKRRFNV